MQKCGPIVKVHMNPYNRAAWQAARDVIKASLSAKVAPRPTSLPAGALGRSGGTRSSGTLPEALAAHKVSAAHTWRRPPPIMGKRRRVTWHSSTWPSPPLSRPSQLPSKVRKRLKSAKAAGSAENLENTASGPTPPEGFTGQLGDAAELRRLEEALAVGGHFIGHDQVARTFRNCPRIWHGFCGVRYQAKEQKWRVKAVGDEKELPGRQPTLVAAATALAKHLGVEVPALGCGVGGGVGGVGGGGGGSSGGVGDGGGVRVCGSSGGAGGALRPNIVASRPNIVAAANASAANASASNANSANGANANAASAANASAANAPSAANATNAANAANTANARAANARAPRWHIAASTAASTRGQGASHSGINALLVDL